MTGRNEMDIEITPQAIRAQVSRILAYEAFARSPRMRRFLEFIVEETLAGHADQLGEYAIGVGVYDRGEYFEPALDPIVRNDARRLRFKLMEYYAQLESRVANQVLIDIPKGGYVPVFFPVSASGKTPAPADHPQRLGVLPFEVLSVAPEGVMYGRALCMSLTASLTNLQGVEAIAHGYLREQPLREAASELRLSHAIHGSVVKSGGRCRVTINLIHVPNGAQLWAREYDFESGEIPTFPSEITGNVVSEVTARLGTHRPQAPALAMAA